MKASFYIVCVMLLIGLWWAVRSLDEAGRRAAAAKSQKPPTAPAGRNVRVQTGLASYYADKHAGNLTASGEIYDPKLYTAAHRSLPFGTVCLVHRVDNSEITSVVINDRGPFIRGRIIDLSRAAAEDIGLLEAGVAKVKITYKLPEEAK